MEKHVIVNLRIKQIRESKGLTQLELANKVNIDQATLSQYETGKMVPDIFILWDIADELHVSLDDLIKGKWDKQDVAHL